jgi:isoquinoline 1-oxidoreductase subunit beta
MEVSNINRRKFLKLAGISGAFLAIGFDSFAFGTPGNLKKFMVEDFVDGVALNPFVIISKDGTITIMATVPELGQGIFQSIPAIIAEELEVDMDQITIVKSSASRVYGRQSIGGSRSIKTLFKPMRELGAATKEVLLKAAANEWSVAVDQCYAKSGVVYRKGADISLAYNDLVDAASKIEITKSPKLKNKKDFRIIGKATKRTDLAGKVNGTAGYAIDAKIEGLFYASIERCSTLQGSLEYYDAKAALAIKGVEHVMEVTRTVYGKKNTGVAVIAKNQFSALEGRKNLNAQWSNAEFSNVSTKSLFDDMKKLTLKEGLNHKDQGDFQTDFNSANDKLDVTYELPYLSHSCMEPMNATVHVRQDNTVEVWAGSQQPQVQRQFAKELGIPEDQAEEKIKVHLPFLGGGFGRRGMNDSIEECFQISKELRIPIKLVWSREDDTNQGPWRQGTVHGMKASFDTNGNATGMQHKMVSQAITTQSRGSNGRIPFEVMEGINTDYDFKNFSVQYSEYKNQIPIHWWRSVFGSTNGFPHESFIDEIAIKSKADPLEFRKEKLKSVPRLMKVLERLEMESNWKQQLGNNEGKGVAIVESFGSIVAHAVFLKRESGKVNIIKVVSVVDCGIYVNPDQVKAQTEGNIIFGLTAALKDPITFKDGAAEQSNFHDYRMLRINEAPQDIQIHIMENDEAPGGMGEPGLPPIAPALANAVFDMTGKRIRKLPFDLQEI